MTADEDIKHLILSLLQGFYWFDEGLQNYLRSKGWPAVTRPQSMVMANVVLGFRRPSDIARNMDVSRQAIHATTNQMVKLGMLALVDDPNGPLKTDGDKEAALVDAALPVESWRASAKLADFRMVQRNFRAATAYYGEAIRRSLDMDITPVPLTDAQKSELMKRASAAKTYALDDGQGTRVVEALPTIRDIDGSIGGVYAIRGINPIPVPVPINFKYGTDQFTDTGAAMAKELADVLKEQKPKEITLVGHTDPVGTDDYNMGLSEKRVRAVARFLGAQGIALTVNIVAKGKRDPFDVSVLPIKPTRDEEYALDRRVELVR